MRVEFELENREGTFEIDPSLFRLVASYGRIRECHMEVIRGAGGGSTLDGLAGRTGYSKSYVSKVLKELRGMGLVEYGSRKPLVVRAAPFAALLSRHWKP